MGNGHGGRRAGAGRKPKSLAERALDGGAGHRQVRVLAHPSAPALPAAPVQPTVDEADAPDGLTFDERKVWLALAPHAMASGTLTPASAMAFQLLCKNWVLMERYAASVQDAGSANHRGLIQRVQADLTAFNIRPCGKPMTGAVSSAAPAEDPRKAKYLAGRRA